MENPRRCLSPKELPRSAVASASSLLSDNAEGFCSPNPTVKFPINPYGKAKKMAEDIILDFSKSKKADMAVMILRYVPFTKQKHETHYLNHHLIPDLRICNLILLDTSTSLVLTLKEGLARLQNLNYGSMAVYLVHALMLHWG
jgi:nucleoside-diphosphate-sugar epimerase